MLHVLVLAAAAALAGSTVRAGVADLRIFGGENATKDDYPPIVSLSKYLTKEELADKNIDYHRSGFLHLCGGEIIHPEWVLTAAHCLEDELEQLDKIWIRAGFIDLSNDKPLEPGEANYQVEKAVLHPSYENPTVYANDIAVVKINGSFGDRESSVLQGQEVDLKGEHLTTLGWGVTEDEDYNNFAPVLKKVSDNECERYRARNATRDDQENQFICHGSDSGKGVCHRDSGGPLLYSPKKIQIGVLSIGIPCGAYHYFQKVSIHLRWIEDTIGAKVRVSPKENGVSALEPKYCCLVFVFLANFLVFVRMW